MVDSLLVQPVPETDATAGWDLLRRPSALSPPIRPWLGALLWLLSVGVVVIFGQFLLPEALTREPVAPLTTGNVAVGTFALGTLLLLHVAYWRRVTRHLRAEARLRRGLAGLAEPGLTTRGLPLAGRLATFWPAQLIGFGVTVGVTAGIVTHAGARALASPAGSPDSGLLTLLLAAAALWPYAVAFLAVGLSRARLARLRARIAASRA